MRGWFDFARENGGPTVFEKDRAQVAYDTQLLAIGTTFATVYVAFLFVLLGIRKARLKTFITVTMLVGVGFSILASLYGDGWHVSNAHILAQYRSFCTHQLRQQIHVNIGLNSMNITLQRSGAFIVSGKHNDDAISSTDPYARARQRRALGTLTGRAQTPTDENDSSPSLLLSTHPMIPATIQSYAVKYADDNSNRTKPTVVEPTALTRERRLLSLQENRNNIASINLASISDQQLESVEPISSSIQSLFQPESPASYFMFPHERDTQSMYASTDAPQTNHTQLSFLTTSASVEEVPHTTAESVAAVEQARARNAHEDQMWHTQPYFYYNERFAWWAVNDITREYSAALVKGLPYPILTVVEYMSIAGGGLSWGHYYRSAGYYTSALLWAAFSSWLASILLFCIVSRYGAYMCACTGALMLAVNVLYAVCVPSTPLTIKFEEGTLTFSMGWCFFLVLATGFVSLAFAALVATMEYFSPHWFSTVLELDYDTPFSYRPINKRMTVRSVSMHQQMSAASSEMYETYEEAPTKGKSYFTHLPQIIRSRIDERRYRNSSAEKQRQRQAARMRTAASQPALPCIREDASSPTASPDTRAPVAGQEEGRLIEQQRRNSATEPILTSSANSSGVFMTALIDSSNTMETSASQEVSNLTGGSESMMDLTHNKLTSAAGSSRTSVACTDDVACSSAPSSNSIASKRTVTENEAQNTANAVHSGGSKPGGVRMRQSSSATALNSRRPTRISFAHLQFGPNPPPSSAIMDLHARLEALGDKNDSSTPVSTGGNLTPSSTASVQWPGTTPPYADEMNIPVQWQPMVVDEDSGMEHYKEWERLMHERAMQKREAQLRAQQRRSNSLAFMQSAPRPAADDVRFALAFAMSSSTERPAFSAQNSTGSKKWAGLRMATKFAFSKRSHSVAPQMTSTADGGNEVILVTENVSTA